MPTWRPYNDRIDAFIGVSGLGGDPAYPEGLDYPLPPHPLGKAGRKAAAGMNALGWHWWPGTNAIPSQKFKELSQCARWGTCEWGCPESSKASSDIAFWPHALRSGATLVHRCPSTQDRNRARRQSHRRPLDRPCRD
jgi:hypothetical protein